MNIETVGDLMELLESFDSNVPIRIAHQPDWPLAAEVANVRELPDKDGNAVLWIAATSGVSAYAENPYAPGAAWEQD